MSESFEGHVALITGAGSGIGLAAANAFSERGASVVLAGHHEESVRNAAEDLVAAGHEALAIGCDVADETQVANMVAQTVATFGRLDMAFNNAGVQSPIAETADADGEEVDRVNAINLRGIWSCMKYELQQMRTQGRGAIVNTSSLGGLVGIAGRGAYHASKHGVLGLTKSAALEYAARGIRINAVCPGIIDTPMVSGMLNSESEAMNELMRDMPIGRLGRPEEVAAAVLWLCSPAPRTSSVTPSSSTAATPSTESFRDRCDRSDHAAREMTRVSGGAASSRTSPSGTKRFSLGDGSRSGHLAADCAFPVRACRARSETVAVSGGRSFGPPEHWVVGVRVVAA